MGSPPTHAVYSNMCTASNNTLKQSGVMEIETVKNEFWSPITIRIILVEIGLLISLTFRR